NENAMMWVYTNTSVQNKDSHIWLDGFPDLYHFFEQFRLLFMPTRSIHNDYFEALLLELCYTLRCDRHRISFSVRPEVCNFGLGSGLSGLVKSTRTESIRTDDARFESAF